jgi:hypothetical protein
MLKTPLVGLLFLGIAEEWLRQQFLETLLLYLSVVDIGMGLVMHQMYGNFCPILVAEQTDKANCSFVIMGLLAAITLLV